MPPKWVHVNGSVNLPDTETAMRELATRIPALTQIPDGETGEERKIFMEFLLPKFKAARGLELVEVSSRNDKVVELAYDRVQLVDGVDPMDIDWPEIGYCEFYRQSWEVFRKLQREGVIAPATRFQVQYSTPYAGVGSYVRREDALRVLPSYEDALFADLDRLLSLIPANSIAVQWDLPMEIGALEAPELFAVSDCLTLDVVAANIARCIDHVPVDVPVGMHLCYGDAQHRHWKEPTSLRMQIDLINAVAKRIRRNIDWTAFTVPQYASDDSFFAPLADLTSLLKEPYLALVPYHPSRQPSGTIEKQVHLVDRYLGQRQWGICTECGLSGVARPELPALLNLHSSILGEFQTQRR
jgi:hypothetical protein